MVLRLWSFDKARALKSQLWHRNELSTWFLGYTGKVKIGMDVAALEFLTKACASLQAGLNAQIVGDDLLVTNPRKIKETIEAKACNALLLKVNQIGSMTKSVQAALDSKAAGWGVMISHHSGETEDTFTADLAVRFASDQIKTGAPCRSELAKYNQIRYQETAVLGLGRMQLLIIRMWMTIKSSWNLHTSKRENYKCRTHQCFFLLPHECTLLVLHRQSKCSCIPRDEVARIQYSSISLVW
ncbi:unnamed protein product [Sphagnum balticum]